MRNPFPYKDYRPDLTPVNDPVFVGLIKNISFNVERQGSRVEHLPPLARSAVVRLRAGDKLSINDRNAVYREIFEILVASQA